MQALRHKENEIQYINYNIVNDLISGFNRVMKSTFPGFFRIKATKMKHGREFVSLKIHQPPAMAETI